MNRFNLLCPLDLFYKLWYGGYSLAFTQSEKLLYVLSNGVTAYE